MLEALSTSNMQRENSRIADSLKYRLVWRRCLHRHTWVTRNISKCLFNSNEASGDTEDYGFDDTRGGAVYVTGGNGTFTDQLH